MDETQQSRASDAAAAATRKRRSSILKSQRPPRTPFSELEFHVATPTDTSKSRRVSFSKRTGVAEFVTNEATTTWKNFYEEHNKSLESSGNDSGAHAPKPAIGHLGKRLFDQQFQEVEAIDFMASIDNLSTRNSNTSMNKVNFTEQLASLECTTGEKYLLNPQANLEMSAFTDCKSNVFGEDFALPTMGEMSGRIDVNFSAVQAIGSTEVKDDLDQIQEDLQNAKSNVVCPGPFNDRRDLSEYIEVDFNSTCVVMRNDESDMSITDTIQSPKVQDVSKSNSFKIDKKSVSNKDWVADKENIVVFEGCTSSVVSAPEKRKTIVYENDTGNISITQALPVNIILPESKTSEKRKTIVYDNDVSDISVTQAVPVNIMIVNKDTEKRKTIIYENDTGNISVTQAIPSNIILPDMNKTIISQDNLGNISITQGIPIVKIISSNISQVSHKSVITDDLISKVSSVDNNDKHKTIFYGNESMEISRFDNNMSITKPIDTKHLLGGTYKEPQENLVSEINSKNHNISTLTRQDVFVYQASATYNDKGTEDGSLPSNPLNEDFRNCEAKDSVSTTDSERKESCVKVDINTCESQAQWLKQDIYDQSDKNVDSKKTVSKNAIAEENKENIPVLEDSLSPNNPGTNKGITIVYDNDMGNISVTQAIPANIIYPCEKKPSENRITIDCDADAADISVTQAVPVGVLLVNKDSEIPKSTVYNNEEDISVTQAIPTNIILTDNEIIESDHEMNDISFTQVIPAAKIISSNSSEVKNNTIVIDNHNAEITPNRHDKVVNKNVSKTDVSNISLTKPIDNIPLYSGALEKSMINELLSRSNTIKNDTKQSMTTTSNTQDLFVYHAEMAHDGLVTKDSSEHIQKVNSDDVSLLRKSTSVSSAKTESNVSYVEMNRSLQMSRLRLLTLESKEQPKNDQENNRNNALSDPNIAQLNTTDAKLLEKSRQAVLDDLLDMSQSSLDAILDNDATVTKPKENTEITDAIDNKSNDSTNHSIKENNDEAQTDRVEDMVIEDKSMLEYSHAPLALEYKQEKKSKMSFDALKQMLKTKLNDIQNISAKHRQHEKDRKADIEHDKSIDKNKSTVEDNFDSYKSKNLKDANDSNELSKSKNLKDANDSNELSKSKNLKDANDSNELFKSKNLRDANDTNELLEMLSDLTDKSRISDVEEPKESVSRRTSQHSEANEPRRLSVAPNRLSIVLSREDLLNNISMAHAALQKSMEIDESIADTSITSTEEHSPPKPARTSSEVVKKLKFEDESANETSVKSDMKSSPLKKPAFEEIPEMTDHKFKVIPSYLNDVSDDVKALMDDLVKPNADAMPFQPIGKVQNMQNKPSTSSMQIQANLITSSQIAINDDDSNSDSTSSFNLGNLSSPSLYTDTKSLKSSLKSSKNEKPENLKETVICPKFAPPSHTVSDRVIIFDQNNPLNNVLLVPPDYADAHRYRPGLSVIIAKESESDVLEKVSLNDTEQFDTKFTQYNVNSVLLSRPMAKPYDKNILEIASTSTSFQESVRVRELKDTKVNTVIAMKQNEELLETSSSLTLVDDAVTANNFNVHLYTESENNKNTSSSDSQMKSPAKIYENDEEDSYIPKTNSSDFTSTDEKDEVQMANKPKKRNYSPFKRDNIIHGWSSSDNTPKQISKMQKLSTSPYLPEREKLKAEKDYSIDNAKMEVDTSYNTKDSPSNVKQKKESPRKSKRGANITVQQLITEYDFEGNIDQEALSKNIIKALSRSGSSSVPTESFTDVEVKSLGIASSFTSSKNQMEMRDARSVTTTDTKSSARSNRSEWQPESKESAISSVTECDSSVNVVAKIDMLPFMGSHECEWEPSSSDTWSFRLLHARVRLTARLAHRHDNATRTRVRADTPVLSVALDVAHRGGDIKNSVAILCVNFAADTMRQYIGRGCSRAGEVPALLRRCAAAARVALRWGRAMHEAKLHLAYTLRQDKLALKVANIALRSVWEVTMRLELVTEPNATPWPRACDVKVTRVVSDVKVTDEEVEKLLSSVSRDWGHVPKVIWKIFSYLKNKTRGDELLGLS